MYICLFTTKFPLKLLTILQNVHFLFYNFIILINIGKAKTQTKNAYFTLKYQQELCLYVYTEL